MVAGLEVSDRRSLVDSLLRSGADGQELVGRFGVTVENDLLDMCCDDRHPLHNAAVVSYASLMVDLSRSKKHSIFQRARGADASTLAALGKVYDLMEEQPEKDIGAFIAWQHKSVPKALAARQILEGAIDLLIHLNPAFLAESRAYINYGINYPSFGSMSHSVQAFFVERCLANGDGGEKMLLGGGAGVVRHLSEYLSRDNGLPHRTPAIHVLNALRRNLASGGSM